ncbi:hypothetical protein CBD41_00685 [bacterium TMED181]|nr:hypothetical protein [Planctomycetota bacterium]OUW47551.1 MAG: hypothetical protein CBD41_00685 [bacterium TMED181]
MKTFYFGSSFGSGPNAPEPESGLLRRLQLNVGRKAMSLAAHGPDGTLLPLRKLLSLFLVFMITLTIAGCGGEDISEKGGEGSSGSSDDLISQVEELISETEALKAEAAAADAEKYMASDYEAAEKVLSRAKDYLDDGEGKKARTQVRSAKRKFDTILKDVTKIAEQMQEIENEQKTYADKLAAAQAAGADKLASSEFNGAKSSYEKAMKYVKDGKAKSAKKYIGYAIGDLDRALEEVGRKTAEKTKADEEKVLMAEKKQLALDAGAEEKALRDLEYARDRERLADQSYESGDFDGAARSYRDAKTGYVGALETAKRTELAANNNNTGNNSGSYDDGGNGYGGGDEVPGIDDIEIPDIGVGGDNSDLSSGLPALFSGVAEYNSAKGSLSLNWSDGTELQQDMKRLAGDPANAIFEGDEGVGSGQDGNYVMAGNTAGYYVVNAGFEDGVVIRAKVLFQLLINKPDFELVLMSDGGGDFYAISYGANARVYNDGLKTSTVVSPVKMYRKSPKDWVQKREPYDLEVRYFKSSEDEKGVLEAKINGETTVKLTTDKYRKGFAGFRWNDTKFIIQELEVRGLVDEEWAKKELNKAPEESSGGGDDDFDF